MVIKKVSFLLLVFTMAVGNLFAQFDANKTYTIANNNDGNMFIQEHDATGGSVVQVGSMSNRAYWQFVATENSDCYYIKNALTGKYLQGYSTERDEISSGDSPVKYYVKADASGSYAGKYRFAVTTLTTHDFTAGTLGLNWEGAADWEGDYDCLQAFASVAGGNPRSAWIVTEVIDANKKYALKNHAADGYLKDDRSEILKVETGKTSNALWQFEASENEGFYYIKNLLTGRYIQSTKPNESLEVGVNGPVIQMGTDKQEFKVVIDPQKGVDVFGFASTDQSNLSFSGNETAGINWRNNENIAQSYFANTGTDNNPRSFWKLEEVETVDFKDNADNTDAIAAAEGDGKNAVVTRSMAKDMWNTLVVPHAMDDRAITRNFGESAMVAALNSEAGGVLKFSTVAEIEAGKPYLVKPTIDVVNIITMNTTVSTSLTTDGGDSYKFVGLYAPATIGNDDYFMAADNTLMKNGAGGQMNAFRAYFQATSSQVKALVGFSVDETETGIIAPNGTIYEDTRIFNLAGQQVNLNNTRKGIFIINGKKILVK